MVRVTNGASALPHSIPWQISLHVDYQHHCGGSVITPNRVITAAHCLPKSKRLRLLRNHRTDVSYSS